MVQTDLRRQGIPDKSSRPSEIWYNKKRRHLALNYATIEEFNEQVRQKNVA